MSRAGWLAGVFSASKQCHSSSISGPVLDGEPHAAENRHGALEHLGQRMQMTDVVSSPRQCHSIAGPEVATLASNSSRFAAMAAVTAFLIFVGELADARLLFSRSLPSCSSAADTVPLRPRYLALSWSSAVSSVHAASRRFRFGAGGLQLLFEFGHGCGGTVTKACPTRKPNIKQPSEPGKASIRCRTPRAGHWRNRC